MLRPLDLRDRRNVLRRPRGGVLAGQVRGAGIDHRLGGRSASSTSQRTWSSRRMCQPSCRRPAWVICRSRRVRIRTAPSGVLLTNCTSSLRVSLFGSSAGTVRLGACAGSHRPDQQRRCRHPLPSILLFALLPSSGRAVIDTAGSGPRPFDAQRNCELAPGRAVGASCLEAGIRGQSCVGLSPCPDRPQALSAPRGRSLCRADGPGHASETAWA